jgi:hypothetical protein
VKVKCDWGAHSFSVFLGPCVRMCDQEHTIGRFAWPLVGG